MLHTTKSKAQRNSVLSKQQQIDFSTGFLEFLLNEFAGKRHSAIVNHNTTAQFDIGSKLSIYLRFPKNNVTTFPKHTIIIANISIAKQRMGHGTAILRYLLMSAKNYKYEYIGIEQAGTVPMYNFAEKNGFDRIGSQNSIENNEYDGYICYVASINKLNIKFLKICGKSQ